MKHDVKWVEQLRLAESDADKLAVLKSRCRIEESGCWVWLGNKNARGYPVISLIPRRILNADSQQLTRSVFSLSRGTKPANLVCHSCDNPSCINPNHLWEGTQYDNMRDAVAKGRMVKNEANRAASALANARWAKFPTIEERSAEVRRSTRGINPGRPRKYPLCDRYTNRAHRFNTKNRCACGFVRESIS